MLKSANIKPAITVKGNGTSLWGESDKEYVLTRYEVEDMSDYDEGLEGHGELQVFGKNTDWFQYTDRQIEKEVKKKLKPLVEAKLKKKVTYIGWSEQGMQPDGGWSFDIGFKKK